MHGLIEAGSNIEPLVLRTGLIGLLQIIAVIIGLCKIKILFFL
jgi:hypothetical protein